MQVRIQITGFVFNAIIGVFDAERAETQRVIVDANIAYDYAGDYIDHVAVSKLIKDHIREVKYKTLEEALLRLNELLRAQWPSITHVNLKLTKPDYQAPYTFSASLGV